MNLVERIQNLKQSIHHWASQNSDDPALVELVVVTKTVPSKMIRLAYDTGVRDFGENRVQEWMEKKGQLPTDIRWHLIGHLQTNKVKYVVGQVHLIHSLDRLELADEIERQAQKKGIREVPCLIQVNMSGEETKSGMDPDHVSRFAAAMANRSSIKVKGLMTIGPLTEDEARIRECFRETRRLFESLKTEQSSYAWDILSMGMSADYKIAIEEGANMLRIGSLIFPRNLN